MKKSIDRKGLVYLVGAGPGDEELITLKGLKAIKKADTIVYDRLASPNLLDYRKEDASLIYVGKKAGNHSKSQDQINEILYQEAKAGKIVVRLKGGDPYVFGRGGEEAIYLRERGISFITIPGVSSAIGGLAYSGIPITHRDLAASFHVITGQRKDNKDLDYQSLAKLDGSLVFLMGFSKLEKISQGLIKAGKDKNCPVAVINWATTSRQKTLVASLENIVERVEEEGLTTPALIVVGPVVSLHEELDFLGEYPLFGKNIVITRERKRAGSTIEKFRDLGANVLSFPMIRTEFTYDEKLDRVKENIANYDYIFFTSVNGVDFFMEDYLRQGDIRDFTGIKFLTIGKKTYKALKKYGIKAELMPDLFEGMEAVELLKKYIKKDDRVLVPRARLGRNEIVEELKLYSQLEEVKIYDTLMTDQAKEEIIEALEDLEDKYYIFTSSSTFNNFKRLLGDDLSQVLEGSKIVSIGPITSETIRQAGYEVDIEAREYTIDGIIERILESE